MRVGSGPRFPRRSGTPSLGITIFFCFVAAALLGFFLAEIAPVVYNQGVADAQSKLQAWVGELDIEVQEEEFAYWKKSGRS